MAARQKITPKMIQQMIELYETIGTYSGVAKAVGVSSSTAAKYIKEAQQVKTYDEDDLEDTALPKPIESIRRESLIAFCDFTDAEQASYDAWIGEFKR